METRIKYELNPEATYLIAGGLGGLGRAMARWLVSRGARHLILLSRSGPRTPEARELLIELAEKRVIVEAPACDVTDSGRLRSVLAICSERMPPIKGCIQSSMVMTVRESFSSFIGIFKGSIQLILYCRSASSSRWDSVIGKTPLPQK